MQIDMTSARTLNVAVLVGCGVAAWILWPEKTPVGVMVEATPAPAVAKHTTVPMPIKTATVKAYAAAVKHGLNLPQAIQDDSAKLVLQSSEIKANRRDYSLTTVMDANTGETVTLAERQPLPWLARDVQGSMWLGVGLSGGGKRVMRAEVEQNLLDIKNVTISGRASLDLPIGEPGGMTGFAGVGAAWRW